MEGELGPREDGKWSGHDLSIVIVMTVVGVVIVSVGGHPPAGSDSTDQSRLANFVADRIIDAPPMKADDWMAIVSSADRRTARNVHCTEVV